MSKKLESDISKHAISEVVKTQIEALTKVPVEQVGILQTVWIMCVLVALIGGYVIYKGYTFGGLIALGFAFIVAISAIYVLRPKSAPEIPSNNATNANTGKILWTRVTVIQPIPLQQISTLETSLREIRTLAQSKYANLLNNRTLSSTNFDQSNLRINVFLPDTQAAEYGEVCGLFIPNKLHHGMTDVKERQVRFRPNEGLTGRVFSMKKAYGALRETAASEWQSVHLEGASGVGDDGFYLTAEQINQINPDLRWIVSFPLQAKLNKDDETFGVLNIDGLITPLTAEEMQAMFVTIKPSVAKFAEELFKLDKRRVTITVNDV